MNFRNRCAESLLWHNPHRGVPTETQFRSQLVTVTFARNPNEPLSYRASMSGSRIKEALYVGPIAKQLRRQKFQTADIGWFYADKFRNQHETPTN